MAPVHTNEMHRTIPAESRQETKARGKEGDKLSLIHLSRSHGELSVVDRAISRGVTIDGYVVRGIYKNDISPTRVH